MVVIFAILYFLLVMYGSVHNIIVLLPSILWFTSVSANHYIKLNYVCFMVRNCFAVIISP